MFHRTLMLVERPTKPSAAFGLRHVQCRRALFVALLAAAAPASAQIDARMFRQPAVSAEKIAFVYAGDIWLAPKTGGTATRLTSPLGEETFPRFSPDGTMLAYSADYDGSTDVYVVPVAGGERDLPVRR